MQGEGYYCNYIFFGVWNPPLSRTLGTRRALKNQKGLKEPEMALRNQKGLKEPEPTDPCLHGLWGHWQSAKLRSFRWKSPGRLSSKHIPEALRTHVFEVLGPTDHLMSHMKHFWAISGPRVCLLCFGFHFGLP